MKTKLFLILCLALFSCKKEKLNSNGCLYEAPKDNYIFKISLIDYMSYEQYKFLENSGQYGKLIFVKTNDCNCPVDYVDMTKK